MAARRPRPTDAERALYRAVKSAGTWLASQGIKASATKSGRERVNAALDVVHYATQALDRMQQIVGVVPKRSTGFDVGGELLPVETDWDAGSDHGQDVETEREREPPRAAGRAEAARRRR